MLDDAVIDTPPAVPLDRRMVRLLCVVQGVFSLGWLAMTPMVVRNGSLSVPSGERLWLTFWIAGAVSAALGFTLRRWARLTTLAWNIALFLTATYAAYLANQPSSGRSLLDVPGWSTLDRAWLEVSASVAVYCAFFGGMLVVEGRRQAANITDPRLRQVYPQAAGVFLLMALILAKIGFSAWRQLGH